MSLRQKMIFGFIIGFLGMQCIQSALKFVAISHELEDCKLERDLYEEYIYTPESGYWDQHQKMQKEIDSLNQVIKTLENTTK